MDVGSNDGDFVGFKVGDPAEQEGDKVGLHDGVDDGNDEGNGVGLSSP